MLAIREQCSLLYPLPDSSAASRVDWSGVGERHAHSLAAVRLSRSVEARMHLLMSPLLQKFPVKALQKRLGRLGEAFPLTW